MTQVEITAQVAIGIAPALNGRSKVWLVADAEGDTYGMVCPENTVGNGVLFQTADQMDELAEALRLAAARLRGGHIRVSLPPPTESRRS